MKKIIVILTIFMGLLGLETSAQDIKAVVQINSIDRCITYCINTGGGADLPSCLRKCLMSPEIEKSERTSYPEAMCGQPKNGYQPFWNNIECLIEERVREKFEGLVSKKLAGVILMMDQDCATLGSGWHPYGIMAGHFPLATGRGQDDRGETITFNLGMTGGEYQHQLSIDEMPEHAHRYLDRYNRGVRGDYGDDEPTEHHNDFWRTTKPRGRNHPHNNMPPYLALNFCHYQP